jgi:hypothetical protein
MAQLKQRARHLNDMADALRHLASACEGDSRPECPIIKGLAGKIPLGLHCAEEPPRKARLAATSAGRRKAGSPGGTVTRTGAQTDGKDRGGALRRPLSRVPIAG